MQRKSVDLPEPLDPMRHTTSWSSILRSIAAEDLEVLEPLVHPSIRMAWS